MTRSMTGFSSMILTLPQRPKKQENDHHIHLSMTLKTLNSRFFEVNCKLPYSLAFLETELIKYFKTKLFRGTIQFSIHMSDPSALTGVIEPAFGSIKSYLAALDAIKQHFSLSGTLEIKDIIELPHIFETQESPLEPETIERIWTAIHSLTETCDQARVKEGLSLEKDLEKRIETIRTHLKALEPRAEEVMTQKKQQLFASLQAVATQTGQEASSEAQSAFLYNQLEKLDIHEEIFRFKTHLENFASILQPKDIEKGKKLDFTLQELFREINTITSKCSDSQICALAINCKVELEKAREQAQNIV